MEITPCGREYLMGRPQKYDAINFDWDTKSSIHIIAIDYVVYSNFGGKVLSPKNNFSGMSRKASLGNVVRKLHAELHWGSSITIFSKIGELLVGRRKKNKDILNPFRQKLKIV